MPSTTSLPGSDPVIDINPLPERDLGELIDRLGYVPSTPDALGAALAHRSWCAENPGAVSNERLEYLGDAVLGMMVSDLVYHRFPEVDEGGLTDLRKAVVNAVTLAEVAAEIDLGAWILLGRGEEHSGGREKPSILSDALEAVIAAVHVDGGFDASYQLVDSLFSERIDEVAETGAAGHDHKSRLQEVAAKRLSSAPTYAAEGEGPDHARMFTVKVEIDGEVLGEGVGRSKKQAEQFAARAALAALALRPQPAQDVPPTTDEGTHGA